MNLKKHTGIITDIIILLVLQIFLMVYFDIRYLFYDTVVTGGDTASWQGVAHHMLKVLLPNGRLTGWDMGNFCGYPNFSFYFIPPFLLAVLPSYIFNLPLTITLKLAIMSGIFLLPLMTYLGLRAMKYCFPIPVIGAAASLLLIFNESYTLFGGNALSTFAGEFCYMFSFAVFAYFIGSLFKGVKTKTKALKNGILLGLIGLSHLFVFIPAVFLLIYWFFEKGNVRYLVKISFVAFGLIAFWLVPLMAYRYPYTTPVNMIWQAFLSWRYTFMGIGLILLFIGPRLTLCVLSPRSTSRRWDLPMICFSGLGAFTFFYLLGQYLILGRGLFDAGMNVHGLSASPIGAELAHLLLPFVVPASIVISIAVVGTGLWIRRYVSGFEKFCYSTGALSLSIGLGLACLGLYILICRFITDIGLRSFLLKGANIAMLLGIITIAAGWFILFPKRFSAFIVSISGRTKSDKFGMFLCLGFGCVVGYFSAHFLKIPDIRFLPPLIFVLILIFFADTFSSFFSLSGHRTRTAAAVTVCCLCIVVAIFWATKSDAWFRYNNRGYEHRPGYEEFRDANNYLKTVYQGEYRNSLNAPRVGYEKCDMYGLYGGDRVFESLPFFAGRQTMEGIHYASSMASRFMAFLQTEYSRKIKTPTEFILSRINPKALQAHFNLYNVSQLILMTDEAKDAVKASPQFEKEAEFGAISVYRYKGCDGRYVDVPRIRPVLYSGRDWPEDFYKWYKDPDQLDVLLVPKVYVKGKEDLAVFSYEISDVKHITRLRKEALDRNGLEIKTHVEHLRIHFTTNKVGVPHLIKVSYFPNWKVQGAHGIYPVSPHLMLVIPREREVVLTYGMTFWGKLGIGLTAVTLAIVFLARFYRFANRRFSGKYKYIKKVSLWIIGIRSAADKLVGRHIGQGLSKARPYLLFLIILTAVALIIGGAIKRNIPARTCAEGYRAYKIGNEFSKSGKPEYSRIYFKKAIQAMSPVVARQWQYDHQAVIHCMLFTAMSYENLGERGNAEALYRRILKEYPYSRYIGEAYVKIARIIKHGRDQLLDKGLAGFQQGNFTSGLSSIRKALRQTQEELHYLNVAIKQDPYSKWSEYALNDIKKERIFFKGKKTIILSLCPQDDVRKSIENILRKE